MRKLMILLVAGGIAYSPLYALEIFECQDEQGNKTFQSVCDPGTVVVGKKKFASGATTDNTFNVSIILYAVPNCETCESVREFFQARNISITERLVHEDPERQQELIELTEGSLNVPTTRIGDQVIVGYKRAELESTLLAAGYTPPEAEEEAGEEK